MPTSTPCDCSIDEPLEGFEGWQSVLDCGLRLGLQRIEYRGTSAENDIANNVRLIVSGDKGRTWSAYQDLPGSIVIFCNRSEEMSVN